jgi:hypothetical protein
MNVEDALTAYRGELVAAARRWQVSRDRRRRRLLFTASAVALAAVIVGTAVAATGWLVGSPAPPSVKSDFGSYATQLGFNPEPGKAVLAASDGSYKLYVTPNEQGGYCTLVSDPWNHPGPHGEGGDCNSRKPLSVAFWAGIGGEASLHNGGTRLVMIGRTRQPDAARVRFNYPVGKAGTATVGRGGFFIVPVTIEHPIFIGLRPGSICRWSSTFVVLDANGKPLARKKLTFGPRVCFHPPKPVVTTEAGAKTFTLGLGADGYLAQSHPGDKVACRGFGHLVTMTIPRAAVHRHVRLKIKPFPLQVNVEHTRTGRIWVMCQ